LPEDSMPELKGSEKQRKRVWFRVMVKCMEE
jgi:hypothetical protein